MRKPYLSAVGSSNSGTASSCSKNEAGLQTNFSVMQAVRSFCGLEKKPLDEIRAATRDVRASDRMIQYWLSNKYSISAHGLAALLRSDAGFAILENIMGDAKPVWWRRFKKSVALSTLRAEQAAQRKRIEQLELRFDE